MVLQANRELIEDAAAGGEVIREPFKVNALKRRALVRHQTSQFS